MTGDMTGGANLIRILTVDDHPLLREGIAGLVAGQSDMSLVAEASNGREAIQKFRTHRPDVTLMDLQMPPLREGRSIGRALSEEEVLRLRAKAAERPEWQTAYDATILAINTGMRGADIKSLRWCDIDLFNRVLSVPKSKTKAGERTIPLTDEALKTLLGIRERVGLLGEILPSHYIFPSHKVVPIFNGKNVVETKHILLDPTKPIISWRTAWRTLTKNAGLAGLRFHDLRHTVITQLLESGAPEWVIMAIVGHVDRRMLDRYGHIRLNAKRAALEALARPNVGGDGIPEGKSEEGYGTIHGTKSEEVAVYSDVNPLLSQNNEIGTWGFEPQTPTVSR